VRDNQIATDGAECVAIKEAADRNEIRGNVCSGAQVADGAGLDVRSNGNLVAGNQSFGHAGAGVRLGGAADGDGVDNDVRGNDLHDNRGAGLRVMRGPQRVLCGNTLAANAHGDVEGDAAAQLAPAAPCP
jgi:hypothetical protein